MLRRYGVACVALGLVPSASFACATCGCSLNADAATGYSTIPGWRLNFECDYINQEQLRFGTSTVSAAQVVNNPSSPDLGGGEIEKGTINRYLTVGLGYAPNSEWKFSLLVPYVSRTHTTYGVQLAPYDPAETAPDQISGSRSSSIGDLKFIAAYQGFLPRTTWVSNWASNCRLGTTGPLSISTADPMPERRWMPVCSRAPAAPT